MIRFGTIVPLVLLAACETVMVAPSFEAPEQSQHEIEFPAPSGAWLRPENPDAGWTKRFRGILKLEVALRTEEENAIVADWADGVDSLLADLVNDHGGDEAAVLDALVESMEERFSWDKSTDEELLINGQAIAVLAFRVDSDGSVGPSDSDDVSPVAAPRSLQVVATIETRMRVYLPK